jgi:hypothetical protein
MSKKVTVKLGNVEYVWHNKTWVTPHNNMTVSTSLAQKLTAYALQNNLLTREDFIVEKKK